MSVCKNCSSTHIVKNGFVRKKQRYRCKECGFNFVEGDGRTSDAIAAKKAMLILLYSMGKISFNMLGKIFHMWPSQVYRWIVKEGKNSRLAALWLQTPIARMRPLLSSRSSARYAPMVLEKSEGNGQCRRYIST